jgi:general secretion pathway protein E
MASLPYSFSRRFGVVLDTSVAQRVLYKPPLNLKVAAELRRFLDGPLSLVAIDDGEFDQRLEADARIAPADDAQKILEDLDESGDLNELAERIPYSGDLLESIDKAPVIRLVNAILTRAVRDSASDVHLEPYESRLAVRFRVDGVLREVLAPPPALANVLAARVKVMAKLDIAERRLPQDGRITLSIAGRAVDVRVSTIPSGHGERVVLRLLDKQAGSLDLQELGLSGARFDAMNAAIRAPHGVLLVTGPTGSGKTTTLYAALSRLNDHSRNIMTVEDPIEYFIDGIGQTQVNSRVDMSFARGLRAILRQDPDVVMVGEIRDVETAQVAVQASLTGHLVMSTLHTNTAVGAVTRLRDMGVEPFLLSSSLSAVLAQRLVRKLCVDCREAYAALDEDIKVLALDAHASRPVLFKALGCEACAGTGYKGRTAMFELVIADDEFRRLVHSGAAEDELESHARSQSTGLIQHGRELVTLGVTSVAELNRAYAAR